MTSTAGRQRHLVRLALKLLGAAVAGGAQVVVRTQPWWTLAGFGAAFLLAAVAERMEPKPGEIDPVPAAAPTWPFWLVFAVGTIVCAIAGVAVKGSVPAPTTHTLWVVGLSTLLVSAYLSWRGTPTLPPKEPLEDRDRPVRAIAIAMLLLAGVATVSFGWDLTRVPPEVHGDEGEEGWDAVLLLEQKPFNLFNAGWYDLPRFHVLRLAAAFKAFGVNLFALRCTSVVLGVASVLLLFAITNRLWGLETAIFAGLVLATARFFIHMSRTGYSYVDAPFFSVLVVWLYLVGWRRLTLGAAVCCGVAIGLGMQTYFAARLIPLLLTVTWGLWFVRRGSAWLAQLRFFAVIVIGALASAAPAIGYFSNHVGELWSRTRDTSVFSEGARRHLSYGYGTSDFRQILLIQLRKAVTAFHLTGDTSLQYGYGQPLLDWFSGALLVLGLGVLCARPFLRRNQLVLLWTLVPLIVGGALTIDTPFYPRMGGLAPFAALIVAVAVSSLVNDVRAAAPGPARRAVAGGVAAVVLGAIVVTNVHTYFFDYAPNHRHGPAVEISAWIREHGAGKTTYMVGGAPGYSINHGTIRILAYGYAKADIPDLDAFLKMRQLDPANSVFIIMPSARDRIAALAAAVGPLDVAEHHGIRNTLLFYSAVPSAGAGGNPPAEAPLGSVPPVSQPREEASAAPRDIAVYHDGPYMLVRYTTTGQTLQRYTGFALISDVTPYDDSTVLVAEREHDRISAMDLDGNVLWTLHVHRPTCIEVLAPDRFLVCHDDPPGVREMDRAGTVYWQLTSPLREATGAVRLADGNTAVVEGRGPHAVHVFTPDGKIVWSGTEFLAQPRGLGLLPSGELVTAGFDTGRGVIFKPYTKEVRFFEYGGHGEDLAVTPQGDILTYSPEGQIIRLWKNGRHVLWEFSTLYPAYHGTLLADGTVLAAIHHMPDRDCPNATEKAQLATQPRPDYWRWLLLGAVFSIVAVALVRWPTLRGYVPAFSPQGDGNGELRRRTEPASEQPALTRRRRLEIGAYVVVAIGLATYAAINLPHIPTADWNKFLLYTGLTIAAGVILAALQARLQCEGNGWPRRMADAPPMASPTAPMWLLWTLAVVLLGGAAYCVVKQIGGIGVGLFAGAIIALLGGSLEPARSTPRIRARGVLLAVAVVVAAAIPRLYRLESYPPNLHLDMAQWSVQVLELIDTRPATLFTNGWADIPMMGYFWSALWTVVGGRSLAGVRLASAIGGIVTIVAAFFIARRLYNLRTAIVLTAFLAVNHGFVHFSRIQAYMDPIPFQVLAILSLLTALETGRYGWFAFAGFCGGFSALSYHAGRITPPLLALLLCLVLVWYPRTLVRRWRGLLLFVFSLVAILTPQAIVYYCGRANAFGRGNMFPWVHDGQFDFAILRQTLERGLPFVLGTFWFFRDAASQYAAPGPAFFAPMATLLGMAVIATICRPRDLRGVWNLSWCLTILIVGGVLTIDPPFWPRMFSAFVPAALLCAVAVDALWRGMRAAAGRVGAALATVAVVALVALTAWQQLGFYREYVLGLPAGGSQPTMRTEWTQSIMGRDVERWGADALIYIVAANPIDQSCMHPTMAFYDYAVDAHDARLISDYLPFKDPRPIVTYFLPEATYQVDLIRQQYPDAEITTFPDNLGRPVFTRAVVRNHG